MAKKKSQPQPAAKAGYAAKTAARVRDSTSDNNSDESSSQSSSEDTEQSETVQPQRAKNLLLTKRNIQSGGSKTTANPAPVTRDAPIRKKHKTRILKEIRKYQTSTNLLIPKAPFLRLIKEILSNRTGRVGYRVTEGAVEAMREASETMLTCVFEDSNLLALHAKRVTLMPRDMALLLRLRNDFNLLQSS